MRLRCSSLGDFESSPDRCAALLETCCCILTAVVLTQAQGISSYQIRLCYSLKIHYIIIWNGLFRSLYIYTYGLSGGRWQVEHNWMSTWSHPFRALGGAPLGGCCGETIELEGREPTINTLLQLWRLLRGWYELSNNT